MFEEESEADDPVDVSVDFECDEYLEQQQQFGSLRIATMSCPAFSALVPRTPTGTCEQ